MCAMLLVLPAIPAGSIAGSAYAQPSDAANPSDDTAETDGAAAAGVTLTWANLGAPTEVDLYPDGDRNISMRVPDGLTATRLRGVIQAPMNIDAGFLEISDGDGRFLGSVNLPPATSAQPVTPFDVDISAARGSASSLDLSFAVRPIDDVDNICGPTQKLTLSDLSTEFTGEQLPPTTIANFFPSVLEQATIYAPIDASAAEQQAVLTLVSTLPRLYNPLKPRITVVTHPRGAVPPPAPGLGRAVVVEKGRAGLTVEGAGTPGAFLRVSGDDDALSSQVSLLANQLQPLAQTATARVDEAGAEAELVGDTLTFSQLKASGETTFIRTSSFGVDFDRTALGSRFDSLKVHLLADYTPVQKDDSATVVVKSQGLVVYRAALNDTGVLDATFDLDSPMLGQRWIRLDFALNYTPPQTCGPLTAPITFQVDPRSTLTMHRGGPPLGGFGAFPAEFSPNFMVAFDGSGPDQLSYAARIVAAVARLTSTELTPKVVDLDTAANATSGALIVANSKSLNQLPLNPPVRGDGSTINLALPTESQVDVNDGLGSIQAFADPPHNRSVVLVTTTTEWGLVEPLFRYIDGTDRDWSQLNGDVLAAGAAGTPTSLAVRPADDVFEAPQSGASGMSSEGGVVWGVVGAVVGAGVVALIVLAVTLLRRRRRSAFAGSSNAVNER